MVIKSFILTICLIIIFQIKLSMHQFRSLILERQTLQNYCSSFKSCNDCKNGALQCVWCHDVGCTNFPRLHCPKKFYLNNILKKDPLQRFCTEIVTRSPVFIPADVKKVIKLDLKIDDITLHERNIVCEFRIQNRIIQVKGKLDKNTVTCDLVSLKIPRNIGLGHVKLIWGGASPYSNMILMIVYKCQHLAQNCIDCQALNKEFQCGWCKDTSICNLMEECPRRYGSWIDRNFSCKTYESMAFTQFHSQQNLWH